MRTPSIRTLAAILVASVFAGGIAGAFDGKEHREVSDLALATALHYTRVKDPSLIGRLDAARCLLPGSSLRPATGCTADVTFGGIALAVDYVQRPFDNYIRWTDAQDDSERLDLLEKRIHFR